jgi:hypothetical protein
VAQLAEADIMVGSTRIAGRLQVDAGLIRSEAGPLEPRLVVPVAIELSNRPADQMLALTHLTGHLNLGDEHNPGSEVGMPARLDFIPGFYARSLPEGQVKFTTEFRFQLSPIAVHRIEAARHASSGSVFEMRIRCDAALAWIRKTGGVIQPSPGGGGTVDATDPFQLKFGMHSELSYFWTVEVRTLRIQMEQSAWISNVLPGLGIDTVRLVEMTFPPKFPPGSSAKTFDEALLAFNGKRYDECVAKCRGIVSGWNKSLGATKARPMGMAIASRQGWKKDDARIEWLNGLWKAVVDMSNAVHHPESRASAQHVSVHDAKLHLMMTATMSEYIFALAK